MTMMMKKKKKVWRGAEKKEIGINYYNKERERENRICIIGKLFWTKLCNNLYSVVAYPYKLALLQHVLSLVK